MPERTTTPTAAQITAIADAGEALRVADAIAAELRAAKARRDQPAVQRLAALHQLAQSRRGALKATLKPRQPPVAPVAPPPPEQLPVARFRCPATGRLYYADQLGDLSDDVLSHLIRAARATLELSDDRSPAARRYLNVFLSAALAEQQRRAELVAEGEQSRERRREARLQQRTQLCFLKLLREAHGDRAIEALMQQAVRLAELQVEMDESAGEGAA